jgi:hypothetical protein
MQKPSYLHNSQLGRIVGNVGPLPVREYFVDGPAPQGQSDRTPLFEWLKHKDAEATAKEKS